MLYDTVTFYDLYYWVKPMLFIGAFLFLFLLALSIAAFHEIAQLRVIVETLTKAVHPEPDTKQANEALVGLLASNNEEMKFHAATVLRGS